MESEMRHVCGILQHKCGNYLYSDAAKKMYFCCNFCKEKCEEACLNEHTICQQHTMRAATREKEKALCSFRNRYKQKAVVKINPETREIVQEWDSLKGTCEELHMRTEAMRHRIKTGQAYDGYNYMFKEDYEELEGQDNE